MIESLEIRNAMETNTTVVKVRNTLDKTWLEYSLGHQHVRAKYSRKIALQSFTEFSSYFFSESFGLDYIELILPNPIPKINRRYPGGDGIPLRWGVDLPYVSVTHSVISGPKTA